MRRNMLFISGCIAFFIGIGLGARMLVLSAAPPKTCSDGRWQPPGSIILKMWAVSSNHLNLQSQSNGIAVYVDGKPVGIAPALNLQSGNGIAEACLLNVAAARIDCTPSYNTALIATKPMLESGACTYLNSTNGTTQYTYNLGLSCIALQNGYTVGMRFWLTTDTQCATGCSINIDNQGITAIKRSDGSIDPGGLFDFTQGVPIRYDGKVFRIEWQR
jgi:hypothetical protein